MPTQTSRQHADVIGLTLQEHACVAELAGCKSHIGEVIIGRLLRPPKRINLLQHLLLGLRVVGQMVASERQRTRGRFVACDRPAPAGSTTISPINCYCC